MDTGPNGEQRSASWAKAAVEVAKVATGESKEQPAKRVVITLPKR